MSMNKLVIILVPILIFELFNYKHEHGAGSVLTINPSHVSTNRISKQKKSVAKKLPFSESVFWIFEFLKNNFELNRRESNRWMR